MISPKNFTLVSAQSMGATFTSSSIPMKYYYAVSLQAVWTGGTVDGTWRILISNDDVTYSALTGSDSVASGAGDFYWDLTQTTAGFVKITYIRNGGTGTASVQVNGKTV